MGTKRTLFHQTVFDFDAVQLFQHWLGGKEDKDHRRSRVDQIHGKTRHIVGKDDFPIDGLGVIRSPPFRLTDWLNIV